MQEFYEAEQTSFEAEEFFYHADEFNEEAMAYLGESSGEALESEEDDTKPSLTLLKAALVGVVGAVLLMQVFNPRWMLIPDPVRESIGIGKHEHTPSGEWILDYEATCTEDGSEYMICTACKEKIEEKKISAKGHSISDKWTVVKEPACVEDGEEARVCTVCGTPLETKSIPALGHTKAKNWTVTKEPTCTEKGEKVKACTVCGEVLEKKDIAATGHKFGGWTVIEYSSCVRKGSEKRKCSVCNYEETRDRALLNHNYELVETVAATCNSNGYRLYRCSMCGDQYRETLYASGHSFVTHWSLADGIYAVCTKCGATVTDGSYTQDLDNNKAYYSFWYDGDYYSILVE